MIELKNLSKTFHTSHGDIFALKNINLSINDGEIFGIIGLSGAGKSTLVRCINLLERPTEGEVFIDGQDITKISEKELLTVRRNIGMIFQSYNLLSQRNVFRNVCYPLEIAGYPKAKAEARAKELIEMVGLTDRIRSYPAQLSGGQKQRVAIARALITRPSIILADEPTGALDSHTSKEVMNEFRELNDQGMTIVLVTHDPGVGAQTGRIIRISDGTIISGSTEAPSEYSSKC